MTLVMESSKNRCSIGFRYGRMTSSVFILLSFHCRRAINPSLRDNLDQAEPTRLAVRGDALAPSVPPQFSCSVFTSQTRPVSEGKRVSPKTSSLQIGICASRQVRDQLFVPSIVVSTDSCAIACGEREFRGNNRLRAVEKTDFAQRLLLRKLYLQLNQILQVAPSLSGRIYFTDTKYVANMSRLGVHQFAHIQATWECHRHRLFRFPTHSPWIRSLRANSAPPRSLNPLDGINN